MTFQSLNAKGNKDYPQAKNYGKYSLTMTVLNIFFTLCMALLITGLITGCYRPYYYYDSMYMCCEVRMNVLFCFYPSIKSSGHNVMN